MVSGSSKAAADSDVRRRRSHEYNDDDYETNEHEHEHGNDTSGLAGSTTVGSSSILANTGAIGASTGTPTAASSTGNESDTSRAAEIRAAGSGKKRKSDEITRDNTAGVRTAATPAESSSAPRQAATFPADRTKEEQAYTPLAEGSQSWQRISASQRTRNRGLSLRTALFTKNVDRRTDVHGSVIEMQDGPSSSRASSTSEEAKKGFRPQVAVKPVDNAIELEEVDPVPRHGHIRLPSSKSSARSTWKGLDGLNALPNYQKWAQERARRHLPITKIEDAFRRARKLILRIQEIPPSKDGRHIPLDASRVVALIDERTGRPFIDNFIKSSKYTPWNFLPRQLFAQFSKLANCYFLIISILQMIPGLSTTGTYTTIIPLMAFISISMGKEGYEDFRRHRLDKAENNKEARVLRTQMSLDTKLDSDSQDGVQWTSVKWRSLQVGDIVKVERNESVPADLLLLHSKGTNSIAYIETMALDGETNLKPKQPSSALVERCDSAQAVANLTNTEVVVEDPNLDLYNFEGKVSINRSWAPLTNNEVLYRGSVLRNTTEAIGMIVYSGEECKIRMNANKHPRVKAPSLQAMVNKIVVFMVFLVLFLALFNTIAYQVWHFNVEQHAWYLTHAHVGFGPIVISFIIMFNTMIPLSLYVSLEIIKVAQIFMMNNDVEMYDEASDTPFEARTSTINEELGQVSYVFSDKTGTLTENVMKFRKLSVAGASWLHDADLKEEGQRAHGVRREQRRKGKSPLRRAFRRSMANDAPRSNSLIDESAAAPRQSTASWTSAVPGIPQPELTTVDLLRYTERHRRTALASESHMMILSMALCHTCLPEKDEDGKITYQASSPDELALVQAAGELGAVAHDRRVNTLTLQTFPHGINADAVFESYEILDVIEFSSTRKRMSVVVRFPDGRICVMCKGADSVITERLRLAILAHEKIAEVERRVSERRGAQAEEELRRRSEVSDRRGSVGSFPRTSMSFPRPSIGRRSFGRLSAIRDDGDYIYTPRPSGQIARHSMAYSDHVPSIMSRRNVDAMVEDAVVRDEPAVIGRCFQQVNDFATEGLRTLLYGHRFLSEEEYRTWKKIYQDAVTSLTDRQAKIEAAGELIEQQLELTGATAIEDKLQRGVPETIDRLRRANIKLWMLTGDKRETAINIGHSCRLIKDFSTVTVLDHEAGDVERRIAGAIIDINRETIAHSVIVIDGRTLALIQTNDSLHTLFIDLAILADSVICCRASPSQKASLVHSVRRRVNRSVTLAIGDGANDIAMIQEAHVGIGITGKEGLQAARSADYAIAQFRFLNKLLLVHGHWNYVRTCKYTLATFWKEMLFYLTQAAFQRFNGYTGTSLYEQWSLSEFNTLFTSLPVIFLGIFEQDLAPATLLAVPELYAKGQRFAGFNFRVYLTWVFMAASEAMLVFFTMRALYGRALFTWGLDLFSMGDLTFSACVILINAKIQILEQRRRTVFALACICIEIGGWFVWNIALSLVYGHNNEYDVKGGFLQRFGANALWWFILLLIVIACCVYEMLVRVVKNAVWPTDVEVFQQLEGDEGMRRRFEEAGQAELVMGGGGVGDADRGEVMENGGEIARNNGKSEAMHVEEVSMVVGNAAGDGSERRASGDVQEMLSRGFGSIRQGELGGMR